ncbi:MAG: hypothetical protein WCC17_11375 [Candidatus Nitrosopolaris sp.]
MEVRLIVGVCAAVSLVIGLVLLVTLFGGINLTEYITQLAVGLTLLILGIIYWTFRPKIDQWLGSEPSIKVSSNQCWILFTHAKGNPDIDIFQNDRKHEYNSRSELPAFDKMLSIAKNTIDMCGLDLRIIVLLTLVHKDICVTLRASATQSKF